MLCYLYGDVDTKAWEWCVKAGGDGIKETGEIDLSKSDVRSGIVRSSCFCIACERGDVVKVNNSCDFCEFGRLIGECNDEGSLFVEFIDRYDEESE